MEAPLSDLPEFGKIDWRAPWLQEWGVLQEELTGADWRAALNRRAAAMQLTNAAGLPLRFVEQEALPGGVAYEAYIAASACVPTRANLHDFFNGLIWLNYPRIKRGLNALQASELERDGVQQVRGQVRDGATLFDENAVLFVSADAGAIDALRSHDWRALFIDRRAQYGKNWSVFPFGHALLEKLTAPFKAITAHAKVVQVGADFFSLLRDKQRGWLDLHVAIEISQGLCSGDFTPLPVLGTPGWADGQNEAYYLDRSVFRPSREKKAIPEQQ